MIFPITDLLSESESLDWIEQHFHPQGLTCPGCGAGREQARVFRQAKRGTVDYRCRRCDTTYNLYTDTVFERRSLSPRQVVLLLRGVCKGESTQTLAEELRVSRTTAHTLRQKLQANGARMQPSSPLPDAATESDEMYQNAGEKRSAPSGPERSAAPPRQQKAGARDV
jgi:transposase-like protein